MRKWVRYILISLLLAGGAVLCIVRWQAWFGMPEEPYWPHETIDYVFPSPSTDHPSSVTNDNDNCLTILVLGDVHNQLTAADYDTIAARVPDLDLILQVGDWMDRGQNYYYQSLMREWTRSNLCGTPVIACPGNHEYSKGLCKSLSPVWENTFPHPENGPIGVPGASHYVDLPQVRLVVIDTNPLVRILYLTRTLTWLHTLMQTKDDRFIVVMMHHPVLTAGKGRFNPLIYSFFRYALGHTDLVLAGHDHSYMRRGPFVVLNSAGNPKPQHSNLKADAADTVPAYGIITIKEAKNSVDCAAAEQSAITHHPSLMDFRVYRLDNGEIIDSLHVQHD